MVASAVRSDIAGRYDAWFAVECQRINPFFQKITGSRLEENVIGPRINYFANQFGCGIPSHNYNRKKGIGSGFVVTDVRNQFRNGAVQQITVRNHEIRHPFSEFGLNRRLRGAVADFAEAEIVQHVPEAAPLV